MVLYLDSLVCPLAKVRRHSVRGVPQENHLPFPSAHPTLPIISVGDEKRQGQKERSNSGQRGCTNIKHAVVDTRPLTSHLYNDGTEEEQWAEFSASAGFRAHLPLRRRRRDSSKSSSSNSTGLVFEGHRGRDWAFSTTAPGATRCWRFRIYGTVIKDVGGSVELHRAAVALFEAVRLLSTTKAGGQNRHLPCEQSQTVAVYRQRTSRTGAQTLQHLLTGTTVHIRFDIRLAFFL